MPVIKVRKPRLKSNTTCIMFVTFDTELTWSTSPCDSTIKSTWSLYGTDFVGLKNYALKLYLDFIE